MSLALLVLLLLPTSVSDPAPRDGGRSEIQLSIFRDPYTSSDQVTLCRVRAVNLGGRRWSGRSLRFEARSVGGLEPARQRGRFGLELEPYGSLETLIALPGRHDRFEVELLSALRAEEDAGAGSRKRGKARTGKRKPPHPKP